MEPVKHFDSIGQSRRRFVQLAAASALARPQTTQGADTGENVFGPRPGYSPQIGTLVSEMIWMREAVLRSVKGMNQGQLDFLLDNKANRVMSKKRIPLKTQYCSAELAYVKSDLQASF